MPKIPEGLSLMEECALNVQAELEARNEVIEAANCALGALDYVIADLRDAAPDDGHAESLVDLYEALNLWARCCDKLNPQGGYPERPDPEEEEEFSCAGHVWIEDPLRPGSQVCGACLEMKEG